jgi:phosphinothricin acetyltransferase
MPEPAKPLSVRAAVETDVPAITRIYRSAVVDGTASFELEPPDEAEMLRRYRAVTEAGFPYLVCEEQSGAVRGYAYLGQYRPRPAYRFTVENSIYVAPEAHRSGIGRKLLEALIARATDMGYRQMIAVIGDSGQRASIGLHRALGFTFCGTVHSVGWKHGRWLDQVLMQRPLGDGDSTPPPSGR